MENGNTFFVTGGTGNQGSAVACILAESGHKVKALVRNMNAPGVHRLRHKNIELIKGDLDYPETYSGHLQNINGVFALLTYVNGTEKEKSQGLKLVDVATINNVPHFVYSSVIGADANTGIPHWESKNVIERAVKNSGMPFTIIRPASLFENYLIPDVRKRIIKGKLVTPVAKNKVQQFISAEDVGRVTNVIFSSPQAYVGRTFSIAADEMDMETAARTFSEVLGRRITYSKLPSFLTRIFLGKDLHTMFSYVNTHDVRFVDNMKELKTQFPFLMPLKEWLIAHTSSFRA